MTSEHDDEAEFIDRYEVIEKIGDGAMGIVYRVHDARFACDRALKILREDLVGREEETARFRDEGRAAVTAAGDLAHPNIVTVYDVGEHEGRPYIVMELFRGDALDVVMERGETLPIERVLRIGAQLASALHSAHEHGVVHRDIKPGNVLISPDGQIAKLTDFSVAKLKRPDGDKTIPGLVIGAPRYMSPEQALGKTADGRSDLYGLGVVLYELLTNRKAFKAETITALLLQITQETPPPPRSLNPEVPPGVDRIVCRLLEKDPSKRFQSGRDAEEAIRRELSEHRAASAQQRRFPSELIGAALLGAGVALVMGIAMIVLQARQKDALTEQAAEIGSAYAESFAFLYAYYAGLGGTDGTEGLFQPVLERLGEKEDLSYQRIVDNNGIVKVSTNLQQIDREEPVADIIEVLAIEEDGTRINLVRTDDGRVIQVIAPIRQGDNPAFGNYVVGLPTDEISAIGRLTGILMGIITLLVAAMVGLVSFVLISRLSAPLKRIRDGLLQMADGNLDIRMPATGRGLALSSFEAFNNAADALLTMTGRRSDISADGVPPSELNDDTLSDDATVVAVPQPSGTPVEDEAASSESGDDAVDDSTRIFVRETE